MAAHQEEHAWLGCGGSRELLKQSFAEEEPPWNHEITFIIMYMTLNGENGFGVFLEEGEWNGGKEEREK